jgi:hypothetical protein
MNGDVLMIEEGHDHSSTPARLRLLEKRHGRAERT